MRWNELVFMDLKIFNNGQECWEYLSEIKDAPDVYDKVRILITDLEMPLMDGHHLTKLVKSDETSQADTGCDFLFAYR
jgi:two-component system chemotaxis response regulator CheV